MVDGKRNCSSVKCRCKNRVLYNKNDVDIDDNGNKYVHCEKCGKDILLRK